MDLSRRALLRRAAVGAGALLGGSVLTGCGVDVSNIRWDDDTPVPTPTPGPDELARRRAADTAQSLLATCTAAATARPDLEGLLTVVREQHSEHLVALGVKPQQTPDPSATATTGSPAPVSPAASATAGSDPVGDLVARHTAGASEAMTDTGTTSGGLAVLLAQVAACRAVQARQIAAALRAPVPPDPAPATAPPPAATGAPAPGAGQGTAPSSGTGVSSSPQVPSGTATQTAPALSKQALAALAEAIDGEHAAVYGYGVLATRLRGAERGQALAELANHQRIAGQLAGAYEASGEKPPAAAPGYRLPGPLTNAAEAKATAAHLESALAVTDAALVGHTSGELRAVAVDLVLQRALAAHTWGAEPTPFPGRA